MKKRLSILLILSMLMAMMTAFSACSQKEETTKKKKTKKTKEQIDTVETETDPPTDTEPTDSSSDIETEPPESVPTDTSDDTESSDMTFGKDNQSQSSNPDYGTIVEIGPHEIPDYEYHQVTIEEQEILNQDGLVIKVVGYKLSGGNARAFKLNVDNQSGHPVKVTSEFLRINGFEVSHFFFGEFEDQTNTEADYDFFLTIGTDIGDWDPRTAEFRFQVEYTDTEATYKSELASIVTSAYDESVTYDFSYGATIFDDGTMLVKAIDFKLDDYGDAEVLLYIENNRDTTMIFDKEIFRINGMDASSMVYKFVQPHSKTIATVMIYDSYFEELGITNKDVNSVTFQLLIREESNYQDKIYGDIVTVKLK